MRRLTVSPWAAVPRLNYRLGLLASGLVVLAACDSAGSNKGTAEVTQDVQQDAPNVGDGTSGGDTTEGTPDATVQPNDSLQPVDTTPTEDTSHPGDSVQPTDTVQPGDTVLPNDSTTNDTSGDTTVSTSKVGAACSGDADCGPDGVCLELPAGYCSTSECDTAGCPAGASCWGLGDSGSFCLKDCAGSADCRGSDGYVCDGDNTCWTEGTTSGTSPVGGACEVDADCKDAGAFCYPAELDGERTGFFQGYCLIGDCTANSCPTGSTCAEVFANGGTACVDSCGTANNGCNQGYGCFDPGICFPSCADSGCPTNFACDAASDSCLPACTANSCGAGTVCRPDGTCGEPPCTANSCGAGYLCAQTGECVPDLDGGPGPGPGPVCNNLPPRDCTSGAASCGEVIAFEPDEGPGFWDYPINGETTADEYRSYARRDLVMLIKWAAAVVDCKAAAWAGGNGEPIGLGDMSESNGSIPGTREGQPGHPAGTHEDGYDMDIGYFQTAGVPDNKLRPICPHTQGGQEAYHCTGAPTTLDVWRDALFLGLLFQSPRTRVIGVDGQVGPLVEEAMDVLCGQGWLEGTPCTQSRALAYETTDQGLGWFLFHLHHQHISLKGVAPAAPSLPGAKECLVPSCAAQANGSNGAKRFGDGLVRDFARPLSQLRRTRLPY